MKYFLTIILVRDGKVGNIEGGWMSSEESFRFMQNFIIKYTNSLSRSTASKHWRNSTALLSHLPGFAVFLHSVYIAP